MKTVEEKTKELCYQLGFPDHGKAYNYIEYALKIQDRDTRHAIAEACLDATNGSKHLDMVSKAYYDICMGVNATTKPNDTETRCSNGKRCKDVDSLDCTANCQDTGGAFW